MQIVNTASNNPTWRVAQAMGFGGGPTENVKWPWEPAKNLPKQPTVLVIADGGMGFRARTNAAHWRVPVQDWRLRDLMQLANNADVSNPEWIVLKMSAPIGQGDLWQELSKYHSERLVGIVSAAELRRADVRLLRQFALLKTLQRLRDLVFDLRPGLAQGLGLQLDGSLLLAL